MRVASKVQNLSSKFGHARPLVLELFALYATDGQMDGRTDKRNAYCPIYEDEGVIILDAYVVNAELSDNARSWRISTISETGTFEPQYKGTGGPGSLGSALVTSYSYPS